MLPEVETVLRSRGEGCEGYLFKNSVGNKIAANKTRERLQCLFPSVGIDRSKRRLHWHSFRSYFVKRSVEAGVPLNVLMSWTGHDTIKMAMHYAGAGVRDSIREIGRLIQCDPMDNPTERVRKYGEDKGKPKEKKP